jgi:hypothetical protein
MPAQRNVMTPFFAAAIYACACLLVYGTVPQALAYQQRQQKPAPKTSQPSSTVKDAQQSSGQPREANGDTKVHLVFNTKPFKDLLVKARKMNEREKIDLNSIFEMTIEGDFDVDGRLSNVEVTQKSGAPRMYQLVLEFIAALHDSNLLGFFAGAERLLLTLKGDGINVAASAAFDFPTAVQAARKAEMCNALLSSALTLKRSTREEISYQSASIYAYEKQVMVNLSVPCATLNALLSRRLAHA